MSEYKDFEKYLNGEYYPGCPTPQSQWRKDFEAYMAGKTIIPVVKPKSAKKKRCRTKTFEKQQYNKDYLKQRRKDAIKNGDCCNCYHTKARKGKTTCQPCQDKRTARSLKSYYAKKAMAVAA